MVRDAPAARPAGRQSLIKAARRPRAITGGTSDGRVTSVSALVGARPSDYRAKQLDAELANHAAKQKAAGTYVSPQAAFDKIMDRAAAHFARRAAVAETHTQIMRTSAEVKRRLSTLISTMLTMTDYGHDTPGELAEVAVHLGRLDAALMDLSRVQGERSPVAIKTEAAAVRLSESFQAWRATHAV